MSWFWFSVVALLCWSGSDFFSKIGCRDASDKYSQFKMVMAVGLVMGLHAAWEIFVGGVTISWQIIWTYLPVSLLYIGSMALGYLGLRYIELSISSPICNASGALVAILSIIFGTSDPMSFPQYLAIALAAAGVIGLGFVEAGEDDELRAARQEASNYRYAKSWLALALPLAYCLLDAAGTFADSLVLEVFHNDFVLANVAPEFASLFQNGIPEYLSNVDIALPAEFLASFTAEQGEQLRLFVTEMSDASSSSANVAYELTFLMAGIFCLIYTVGIRKQKLVPKMEIPKYIGAGFETVGQFAYIFALADEAHVTMAAPIISSYCAVSVLWSRIFLKEKLSWKHYVCVAVTVVGIIIMGVYDM